MNMKPNPSSYSPGKPMMRASSSMSSILQKSGSMSMTDLPNLPGVKKDLAAINPKLYAQFKVGNK